MSDRRRKTQVNWEAVGAIGEVVGALGVVVTLGYFAIQIRQKSAALQYTNLESTVPETELAAHFYLRALPRT